MECGGEPLASKVEKYGSSDALQYVILRRKMHLN
jgi:hypothetical protein